MHIRDLWPLKLLASESKLALGLKADFRPLEEAGVARGPPSKPRARTRCKEALLQSRAPHPICHSKQMLPQGQGQKVKGHAALGPETQEAKQEEERTGRRVDEAGQGEKLSSGAQRLCCQADQEVKIWACSSGGTSHYLPPDSRVTD